MYLYNYCVLDAGSCFEITISSMTATGWSTIENNINFCDMAYRLPESLMFSYAGESIGYVCTIYESISIIQMRLEISLLVH